MTVAPTETHGGRTALEVAAAAWTVQLTIRAQLLRDVTRLWPMLDRNRLDETWPGWIRAMSLLVRNYHGQSAQAAASSYRAAREQATHSPAPRSLIRLAPVPSEEWLDRAFGYSGPGQLRKDVARPNTALSTTLTTASRIVRDGADGTISATVGADPVALGWYFHTDGDPCFWCALIASRGLVFKGDSFEASNQKFIGDGTAKIHNGCACVLMPVFSHDHSLPDINREARQVYENRGKGPALKAFRQAWESRDQAA